ncbi:MAG TPA: hypothetical protein VMH23_09540 [Bacteroidota bacterium]|nr:hypothetical protein [Bacteroidota bacterium]
MNNGAIVELSGSEGIDFIQRISTNDVSKLEVGGMKRTVLANERGRIIDVVSLFRRDQESLMLVGQGIDPQQLISWLEKFIIMEDLRTNDLTSSYVMFILFSDETIDEAGAAPALPSDFILLDESNASGNLFRLVCPKDGHSLALDWLRRSGFVEVGVEGLDEFRIRHTIPWYGKELTEQYNPLEAGLGALVDWTKGCYIGQEVIARLDTYKKIQRSLVRLKLSAIPSEIPSPIFSGSSEVGTITTTTTLMAPESLALGYMKVAFLGSEGGNLRTGREKEIDVEILNH